MKINYRILNIDPEEQQFTVRYWTDEVPEGQLATEFEHSGEGEPAIKLDKDGHPTRCRTDYTLTLWQADATPEQIRQQIMMNAPKEWFYLKQKVQDPAVDTTMTNVHAFPKEGDFTDVDIEQEFQVKELTETDIDRLLEEIRSKQPRP